MDPRPSLCKAGFRKAGVAHYFRKLTLCQQGPGVGVEARRWWGEGQGELTSRKNRCISIPQRATRLANA